MRWLSFQLGRWLARRYDHTYALDRRHIGSFVKSSKRRSYLLHGPLDHLRPPFNPAFNDASDIQGFRPAGLAAPQGVLGRGR